MVIFMMLVSYIHSNTLSLHYKEIKSKVWNFKTTFIFMVYTMCYLKKACKQS